MDAFVPTGGAGATALVQDATGAAGNAVGSVTATFSSTPTVGNMLIAAMIRRGTAAIGLTPSGWTKHDCDVASPAFDGGRIALYYRVAGAAEPTAVTFTSTDVKRLYIAEWSGLTAPIGTSGVGFIEEDAKASSFVMDTGSITPAVANAVAFAGWVQAARNPSFAVRAPFSEDYQVKVDPSGPGAVFGHRIISPASGSYIATADSSHNHGYGAFLAAFTAAAGGITWVAAPDTIDDSDASSDDVDDVTIANTGGAFWRADLGTDLGIGRIRAVVGFTDNADVTVLLLGGDEADYSDSLTTIPAEFEATGGLAADEIDITFDPAAHRYWRLVLDTSAQDVRVFEVSLLEAEEPPVVAPSKAILEIYVHDEDASRWGEATWATGPATGDEGVWSAAGWQDVTPQGVNAHIIWGSRRPARGILADQNAASWNVQTYDPDRDLDPGNQDGPWWPQLLAGVPIRISHDTLVIRTGYVDEWHYKHKAPDYQGQILATDTISLLNQASVPADSILGNTLLERIQDAINAAGIAVGGIPLPPAGPSGPTIADWEEGAPEGDPTTVWAHILNATGEVLWVPFVTADAGLGLRPWGAPLDRGREITAPNLEDLESISSEDGLYSVARVQVEDPDLDPITRVAAPLPRYGRRMIERREPTVDPEAWADAVLGERAWPGVQYVPGAIHCFTAADVDYFGSIETMERVAIIVPGAVSVQGRVLGGELFVEHHAQADQGATWIFLFSVATDGSTAIGLTTLVADGTGDTLLDDSTETDYLEAD